MIKILRQNIVTNSLTTIISNDVVVVCSPSLVEPIPIHGSTFTSTYVDRSSIREPDPQSPESRFTGQHPIFGFSSLDLTLVSLFGLATSAIFQ
uniref:Uncharacterized protein n=1 Tax=Solanum lycopersicum TaxID=4081 RepID=K4CSR7_SOLLC